MALGDAYQESTDATLSTMAALPLDPIKPEPKHSAWSAVPRGIIAGASEAYGTVMDLAGAYGQASTAFGTNQNPLLPESPEDKRQRLQSYETLKNDGYDWRTPMAQEGYGFARDLRPDPQTSGTAENIFFGLTKGLTKAIGAAVTVGPLAGAGAFGISEGMTAADDLANQGVDKSTRTQVGAVTGALAGASMVIPVAGKTIPQTIGLAFAGGPASFIAQQEASKKILEKADYADLSQQYDPLDPMGLFIATALPSVFGVHAFRSAAKAAKATLTSDQVDAVMTHNLTLQQDIHDTTPPVDTPPIIPRASSLPDHQRIIESNLADKIATDYQGAVREYSALPDSEGGKVLNVDTARELSPDYAASRESRSMLSSAVHEPASYFIKQLYAERLKEMPPESTVMFTSGGTGAGKTTAIQNVPSVKAAMHQAYLVYDTNMNGLESARTKIEQALDAGAKVSIVHVQRDPVDALVNGALPRASRMGRAVPLSAHEATHIGSAETIVRLADIYKNDPRVSIRVVDNTQGRGNANEVGIEFVKGFDYNGLRDRLTAALHQEYQNGSIKDAIYRGTLGHEAGTNPAASDLVRPAGSQGIPSGLSQGQRGRTPNADGGGGKGRTSPAGLGAREANSQGVTAAPDGTPPSSNDPHIGSVLSRAEDIRANNPDMPVATDENGNYITAADELEAIRKEAQEGTDTELGAMDADLLRVAADCFLSTGESL